MKNIYLLALTIFLQLNAQTPPELNWSLNPKNGPTSGGFDVSKVIFDQVSSESNSLPITIGNFSNTGNFNYGNDTAFDYYEGAIGENPNTFIAKHDENDEVLWVKKLYGDGGFTATGAIVVGNFFYVVGELNGTIDFNPGSGAANRTSVSEKNVVIAKYDLNGFYVNSKLIVGSGLVSAHKIVNNGNKLAIIGELEGTVDFDPNSGEYNVTSVGEKDGYVSVYSTNLTHQWTQQYGDIGTDTIKDVVIDGNYVYATATTQSTGIECEQFSPDPVSFVGDYTLTTLQTGIFDSVVFTNETVTITEGEGPNDRIISVFPYPEFGLFPAINFQFSLVCEGVVVAPGQETGVGCGSNTTLGPADLLGTYDFRDDGSFNIIFVDDEGGASCGTEYVAEITLTKIGLPFISEEDPGDFSIVVLDGIHESNLVVYDITNGGLQSSTPIGAQIETPLNSINNNLHISSTGEIFVVGTYQGENRFLTYNTVRSDLAIPEVQNFAGQYSSVFMSKFEPISSKLEGLNNNLPGFGDSQGVSIIGSAVPESVVQMYLSSEDGVLKRYNYLSQGEIYFDFAGDVWGTDDTERFLVPVSQGGQGISIEEDGFYYINLDTDGVFMAVPNSFTFEKIPEIVMSEYVPIKNTTFYNDTDFNILSNLNEDNNSLILTYPSEGGQSIGSDGSNNQIFTDGTYDYISSVISEISLSDYQILWEKAGPPSRGLSNCELIPSTEGIFYLFFGGYDMDPRAESEDIVSSNFQKISKYLLDGEYDSSFSYNPRINTFRDYLVHNQISADGSKYFVGHNTVGLDFNNDNNLDLDPVNSNSFYIRKYNSANELTWMKLIGDPFDVNPTNVNVYATVEDSQNNLLLYGAYSGDLDFDSSSSNGLLSNPTTTSRYFMAKYSPNGDLIWAKDWVNDSTEDFGRININHRFVLDNNDNMYFLATLYSNENADSIDLDPSDESAYYINFPEENTMYSIIMKLDSELNLIYGKLMDSGLGSGRIFSGLDNGIAINNEVLQFQYVALALGGVDESILIDVDISEENEFLVESYGKEILVNYNLDGEYISHHVLVSGLNDPERPFHTRTSRPRVDAENNIYTKTIYYYSIADGGYDRQMVIRKYNPNHELQWEKTILNNDLNLAANHPIQLHSSGLIFLKSTYINYLDLSDFNEGVIYSDPEDSRGTAIIALSTNNGELVHLKNYANNSSYIEFSVTDEELLVSGNYAMQLELGFDSSTIDYTAYNNSSEQFYASYLLSETLGVDSNISKISWTVFPNPTSDIITIQINSLDFSELYNALGQRVLVSKSPNISLSGQKPGLYIIKVFDKSGMEFTKKIIKK
tara:strand:- start:456 stop:4436 length:3981 start_codon:yes stop_codon:yes gene_type:complete